MRIAFIAGNYINAYSIVDKIKDMDIDRIVFICDNKHSKTLLDINPWNCDIRKSEVRQPSDLISGIRRHTTSSDEVFIFLTDERFHPTIRDELYQNKLADWHVYIGSHRYLDTILDRQKFIYFIEQNRLASVPRTIPGDSEPEKLSHIHLSSIFVQPLPSASVPVEPPNDPGRISPV